MNTQHMPACHQPAGPQPAGPHHARPWLAAGMYSRWQQWWPPGLGSPRPQERRPLLPPAVQASSQAGTASCWHMQACVCICKYIYDYFVFI